MASANLFAKEPLPDIGSEVWKALWEAARIYSNAAAFPGRTFPVTGSDAHCVLCHQPLSEEASKRLETFEAFILNESKQREAAAEQAYDKVVETIAADRVPMADLLALLALVRDDLGNEDLASTLRREILTLVWRLRAVLRTHCLTSVPALPPSSSVSFDGLQTAAEEIATRISGLQAEAYSPERAALIAERDELADRKWLGVVKSDVLAQIERLKAIEALGKASKETATNKIITQSAGSPKRWSPTGYVAVSRSRSTSSASPAWRSSFSRRKLRQAYLSLRCG